MPEPSLNPVTPDDIDPVQAFAKEAVTTDNSESEDAVLDRLFAADEPAPQRDILTPSLSAPTNDVEYDRALKALQRDGVPADVIAMIKSDPSKVKEWGLKAAKRQADVDAFGARTGADAKKPLAHTPDGSGVVTPSGSAHSGDNESDADPLSVFGEIFGDEAAKPLRDITNRLRAEFDEKSRLMETKYEAQAAYHRFAADYGRNAPTFDEISTVAATIGRENPNQFSSISEIVHEAFRQRMGDAPKKPDPRNTGRPTVGRPTPRPVHAVDREDAVLDILLAGGNRQDAFKAMSR